MYRSMFVTQVRNYRRLRVFRASNTSGDNRDIDSKENDSEDRSSKFDAATSSSSHVKTLLDESRSSQISPTDIDAEFPSDITDFSKTKYKNYNNWVRDQAKHSYRPRVNPKETSLLLFPGQGSQFVGMGNKLLDYPNVADMYQLASKILGYDLLDVCLNGPKQKLDKTEYCQPAIMVTSLAAVEKLKNEKPWAIENCVSTAGYSVGEYSALVFAGSLSFEDALRLVKVRAESMQNASVQVSGRMMTVFFTPEAKVKFACHAARLYCSKELQMENPVCEISNFLYPGCKVLSGNTEALEFIEKNASEFGINRTHYLPVSGPFHCHLMKSAAEKLTKALSNIQLESPIIPVHSNVNSFKYGSPKNMQKLLIQQIYKPVLWEQTLHVLYARPQGEEFPYTFEAGPGRQLGAILRMVNVKAFKQYKNVDV